MATFMDLIERSHDDSFDKPVNFYVKYPEGVTDDYGQTGYYFRTISAAKYMARRAFKAKPGDVLYLRKDM
jgi:hypothetical protein